MKLPVGNVRLGPWQLDGVLLALTVVVLALGLTVLTSASITIAARELGSPFYYLFRQLTALALGTALVAAMLYVPVRVWERLSFVLLAVALLLLVLVLLPGLGHTVNGATRWLRVGPINLQVAEPARLLIVMYLAGYMVRHEQALVTRLSGFVKPMVFVALAAALLLAQPDFGAATVLVATAIGLLFVGGARLRNFVLCAAFAAVALAYLAVGSQYRMNRLTAFMDPWADPLNSGFQLTQSLIAFGRGEWFGVGLGNSVQKLFYLPEAHTDFVFAVLAEEFGLFGVVLTVALFAVLVARCFQIGLEAARVQHRYAAYLAFGIGLWLGLQAFINMGVSMGLLPTKGLTLPLMSYGRSSLVVTMAAVGLLLRIHHEVQLAATEAPARAKKASAAAQRRLWRAGREAAT